MFLGMTAACLRLTLRGQLNGLFRSTIRGESATNSSGPSIALDSVFVAASQAQITNRELTHLQNLGLFASDKMMQGTDGLLLGVYLTAAELAAKGFIVLPNRWLHDHAIRLTRGASLGG
jgi:hypothetical protein